jgi:predicted HAD superfamily hydrolase
MATLLADTLPSGFLSTHPASRDTEVEHLRSLLASRPAAALSLDCFDTILWRAVPKPIDVFLLLGNRLKELGVLRTAISPELFMRMRVMAERAARSQAFAERSSYEIHLDEIYAFAGWHRQTWLTPQELAHHELVVESQITTADPWLSALLDEELQRRQCFIVSDTYFDTSAMRFLLCKAGLEALAEVPIIVSSEHGVSKDGGLLEIAFGQLGIDAGDCIHVGNSVASDVKPAIKAGAATVHFPEFDPFAARAFMTEGFLPATGDVSDLLDLRAGDSGLTALRGRITRHRPVEVPNEDALFWNVGAVVLGPAFTGFAEWVHERADALGIDTALCLMREGRFLAQLLDGVPSEQRTCSAVPFWASREACVRATLFTASEEELSRVLWRLSTPDLGEILKTVGISAHELPDGERTLAALRTTSNTPLEAAQNLIKLLASREILREAIIARSAKRRKSYVRYLRSSLKRTSKVVGLVDLGFGATIQELLASMMAAEGIHLDFRGLYLFTSQRALLRQLSGHLVEGFVADAGSSEEVLGALSRSPEILEAVTTSSDGSLLEIDPSGQPLLAPRGPEVDQDRQRLRVQQGILAFQSEWNSLHENSSLSERRLLGRSPRVLHRVLSRFIAAPGQDVAKAFAVWSHEANFGSEQRDLLVPDAIKRYAGYLAPEHLASMPSDSLYWVGAAATVFNIEDQVRCIQEGRIPMGTFLNDDAHGELLLSSFVPNERPETLAKRPLALNKSGDNLLAWHGRTAASSFVLHTTDTRAVLRIDEVSVIRDDGSTARFDWRGAPRTAPSGIALVAESDLGDGIVAISATDSAVFSVEARPGLPIVGIEILYGVLPS